MTHLGTTTVAIGALVASTVVAHAECSIDEGLVRASLNRATSTDPAEGVAANVAGSAQSHPMEPLMSIVRTSLSVNPAELVQSGETAERALADVTSAYGTATRENGSPQ